MKRNNPAWWNDDHESAWDRVKGAFKRDWEQTKADLSSKGHDLDQDAGDTVKQAVGRAPIPPGNQPNPRSDAWEDAEPGYRYGVGARERYGKGKDSDWNDGIEAKLREEWNDLKSGQTWEEAKSWVRRAWDRKG